MNLLNLDKVVTRQQELNQRITNLYEIKGLDKRPEWKIADTTRSVSSNHSSSDSDKYVKNPYPLHYNSFKLKEKSATVSAIVSLLDLKNQPPLEKMTKNVF